MAYDNTNRGTLGKNRRKEAETHADYTGSINVAGKDYWLNGWIKSDKAGAQFLSLSVRPKDGAANAPDKVEEFKREAQRVFPGADINDEVPF